MFDEGNILYFTPFYFKNGNKSKDKYFVILKHYGTGLLLANLPTSKDSVPTMHENKTGCLDYPEINFNGYVFSPDDEITDCGKRFPKRTHLYGYQIDTYDTKKLSELYPIPDVDYTLFGTLKPSVFKDLLDCFRNSKVVPQKIKRLLNA